MTPLLGNFPIPKKKANHQHELVQHELAQADCDRTQPCAKLICREHSPYKTLRHPQKDSPET